MIQTKATTILAIVAIVAALGAVTSLIPIHQVSAGTGIIQGRGPPNQPPSNHAEGACDNAGASHGPPFCH